MMQTRQREDIKVFDSADCEEAFGIRTEVVHLDHGISLTMVSGAAHTGCNLPLALPRRGSAMVFVVAGTLTLPGRAGQRGIAFGSGEAALVSNGFSAEPATVGRDEALSVVIVGLPHAYMSRVFSAACPEAIRMFLAGDGARGLSREILPSASIQAVLHQMATAQVSEPLRSVFLTSKAYELIALGLERLCMAHCDCALSPGDIERLKRARDILSENLSDPPSLVALAHEVGINDFKLKKGFKVLFDTTPFGYLKERRMIVARSALLAGEQSVTTVANQVGYTNLGHFAAAFRKQFGTTPKAMKKTSHTQIGRVGRETSLAL
ncbi:AraC family transcriptional regulator (plasmid) [Shinella yambaruensis]|uniref:helix-turn-helix transcriptional regulator n=1 Tax=Shinella TaxID=323620 RepID=UPI0025890ACD|nr:AraC family transcriptional regulator [Shinella sp.]MCW5708993.1 helix-turn-helix transcriptional regulator [Shinella sp.]